MALPAGQPLPPVFVFAEMTASRSEQDPPPATTSAVVLTVMVAPNAEPGSASKNDAATAVTKRPLIGRRVRCDMQGQPPARQLAVSSERAQGAGHTRPRGLGLLDWLVRAAGWALEGGLGPLVAL